MPPPFATCRHRPCASFAMSSAATASRHEMCGLWRRRLDIAQWRGTVARAARSEPSFIQVKAAVTDRMGSSSPLPPIAKRGQERRPRRPLRRSIEFSRPPCSGGALIASSERNANAKTSSRGIWSLAGSGQLGLLWGRLELSQRRAQRIKARGVGKFVVFDGAPDCRGYRGKFVVGEVNCRHGPDIIGRHLSSKERDDLPRGARFTDLWRGAAAKARSV